MIPAERLEREAAARRIRETFPPRDIDTTPSKAECDRDEAGY